MSVALIPCPFCGGKAALTTRDVEPQGDPWYSGKTVSFVLCDGCGCSLFDGYFHEGFASDDDAASAWNRRPAPAPVLPAGDTIILGAIETPKCEALSFTEVTARSAR